jgi:hypothetical protein
MEDLIMRIAAGVLIIIASIFDLIAGIGYAFVGGAASVGSDIVQQAATQAAQKSNDPAAQQAAAKVGQTVSAVGGGIMIFGLFLLVMFALNIAGAVVLFQGKAAMFALIVGILEVVACIIGLILWSGLNIVTTIPGLVAGVFVIIAAIGYLGKPAPTAPAATM